jgi:hypothetical protein
LPMRKWIFASALFLAVFTVFTLPCRGGTGLSETRIPDALSSGLDHLLGLVFPQKHGTLSPPVIGEVLDFVASPPNPSSLFYADKRLGAASAYHTFDVRSDLGRILRCAYNPNIPSYAFTPSSLRFSRWVEEGPGKEARTRFWKARSSPEYPLLIRGTEREENTPDLFTGSYYRYDLHRTLILCRHKGQNVFISLAKQKGPSEAGRKGLVLGADRDWNYLYSGEEGINIRGLGWVRAYLYDSFSISVFYEVETDNPLVRCGIFKWVRAGWAGMNLAEKRHIRKGLERYARDFKTIMESPRLPGAEELIRVFSAIKGLSSSALREKSRHFIGLLANRYEEDETFHTNGFSELCKGGGYLDRMTGEEMQALLVRETMKDLLGRDPHPAGDRAAYPAARDDHAFTGMERASCQR